MNFTSNYSFQKPLPSEKYSIDVVNDNSDKLDDLLFQTNLALSYKMNQSLKGSRNGVAELDENGLVPSSQLPSYVDDVLEYTSTSEFPAKGESGKIYVASATNKSYRWSGSTYILIASDLTLGETSSTAYRGDRGSTAYEHSRIISGNPHGVTKSEIGLGSVPNVATNDQTPTFTVPSALETLISGEKLSIAFGKLSKGLSALISHIGNSSNPHKVTASQIGAACIVYSATKPASCTLNTIWISTGG